MDVNVTRVPEFPKVIQLKKSTVRTLRPLLLLIVLLILWFITSCLLQYIDNGREGLDQNIWLLILLSLICFVTIASLAWWLLKHLWVMLGLPPLKFMVSQFSTLILWQQLSLYWLSYALLLLAALGCLSAIC